MFNFEKLNKRRTVAEGLDTNNMEFKPLKEFTGKSLISYGFFFTDGKFGKQIVYVGMETESGEMFLVNMPKRAVEQFEQIADNDEAVQAVVNQGLVMTDIREANTRNGMTTLYTLKNA